MAEQSKQQPKVEKTHDHYMVTCLLEEVQQNGFRFSEMDVAYIKDLAGKFYNDPEYKLSEKQKKWLDIIWEK